MQFFEVGFEGVRACLKTTSGPVFGQKAGWQGATKENTPGGSSTEEQRSQAAFCAKTLRAAGLLAVAGVGSLLTARCGDARNSPPWPRPKSPAAGPLVVFKQALVLVGEFFFAQLTDDGQDVEHPAAFSDGDFREWFYEPEFFTDVGSGATTTLSPREARTGRKGKALFDQTCHLSPALSPTSWRRGRWSGLHTWPCATGTLSLREGRTGERWREGKSCLFKRGTFPPFCGEEGMAEGLVLLLRFHNINSWIPLATRADSDANKLMKKRNCGAPCGRAVLPGSNFAASIPPVNTSWIFIARWQKYRLSWMAFNMESRSNARAMNNGRSF
jgi:hypothetical protein